MEKSSIEYFLADTWWYGLSKRLSERAFENLALLRAEQGFSAIQLVVGVPPEIGPENENAQSHEGFPWTLRGKFNQAYLDMAHDRIQYLNSLGLMVIVYGAWGHQINWLGPEKMKEWWLKIIERLDSLNVIYCLTGEVNLWIGKESKLLPAKSTDELAGSFALPKFQQRLGEFLRRNLTCARSLFPHKYQHEKRRRDWSMILEEISKGTSKPIIVHTTPKETGYEAVSNPELLAANTVQTGHDSITRNRLWRLPLQLLKDNPTQKYINLEPWYEGIRNQFWAEDQLFAYWVSMSAGAISYCYGAHGIWNVGDGKFLSHWGSQTFTQAVALDTPRLLGLSHEQFLRRNGFNGEPFFQKEGEELITIGRKSEGKITQFFPDVAKAAHVPDGQVWLPLKGDFTDTLPARGPVVIFAD